jgi:hypothetical protein
MASIPPQRSYQNTLVSLVSFLDGQRCHKDTVFSQDRLTAIFLMDESQGLWHTLSQFGCQPHWMQVFHYLILEEINLILHSKQASSLGQPHGARQSNKIKGDP